MRRKTTRLDGEKTDGDKPVLRDSNGRFVKGSRSPSPGRPSLGVEATYKIAVTTIITPDVLAQILLILVEDALNRDYKAIDLILQATGLKKQNIDLTSDGNELRGLTADHFHTLDALARQQVAVWEAERHANPN
jgi:hypothetical protein